MGHGLTSCATCDGAFYRNVPVAVVGGGDSACEEASFLTRFASKVYLIHRRDKLRASKIMAERALANPKIEPVWNSTINEYLTDDENEMRAVKLQNLMTGEESELEVKCVFVAIGHTPNTAPFRGKLDMDDEGYLLQTKRHAYECPRRFRRGRCGGPHVPAGDHGRRPGMRGGAGRGAIPGESRISERFPSSADQRDASETGRRVKICDLTQFYSPVSGGVKRYLQEKVAYMHEHTADDRHILIIPGPRTG